VEFGVLPVGIWSLKQAGCVWRLAAMFFLAMLLRRSKQELGMDEIAALPFNKPAVCVGGTPDQVLEGYRLLILSSCSHRGGGGEVGEKQFLSRSKGNQAKLHHPGSATSTLKEDFRPDVLEIAHGRAHKQRRFFGSYAAHGSGRRAAFSGGYAALCCGRMAVFQPLLLLLVEWWPFYFLLACEPEGRQ
jgi:hypothetical protein